MPILFAALFLVTATIYASVGFGGGSTYTALLAVGEVDYRLIPLISLSCNIAVVAGSCLRYGRAALLPVKRLLPALALSIPFAWLGGRMSLSEESFTVVLAIALLGSALVLLIRPPQLDAGMARHRWPLLLAGGSTGLLAGLVGIGGGIFLAPLLYMMRWGGEREIAAASSLFILLNSIAGMVGQVSKTGGGIADSSSYLVVLLPAVIVGGWLGNRLGIQLLPPARIRQLTGILILFVAVRLMVRIFA